jgi:hypothetical protein
MYSPERLEQLNFGYDLDGGGYSFENTTHKGLEGCVVLDSGLEYVLGESNPAADRDCVFLAFRPCGVYASLSTEWPETLESDYEEEPFELLESGVLYETDHECNCHGIESDETHVGWEFTGNVSDKPWPKCNRCDGEGYVLSEGGEWALYGI